MHYKIVFLKLYESADNEDTCDEYLSEKLDRKFPDIDKLIKGIPHKKLQENRRKLKTGFKLFQVK